MQIIPAVDIKGGKCVRLTKGVEDTAIVYSDSPFDTAVMWQDKGAEYLHLIDLDGAFSGRPVNHKIITKILQGLKIPAEAGGGIRTAESIKMYIDAGADRVILGTQAFLSPGFLEDAAARYGPRIALSVDTSSGMPAVEGWTKTVHTDPVSLAQKAGTIIYTDIDTDGMLKGPNIEGIKKFIAAVNKDIIVSGGVSSVNDIKALNEVKGIKGIIIGKALYTGAVRLEEAVGICSQKG